MDLSTFPNRQIVGMPIPGTGTSVWWESQQDPTLLFGMPEIGVGSTPKAINGELQVEPDIEVENDPEECRRGSRPANRAGSGRTHEGEQIS